VLSELRPRWTLIENVPGLTSSDSGRDFTRILLDLEELGYGWAYRILDARFFGVAQRRRRVFVVGCLGNQPAAAQVLALCESCGGHPAARREARQEATSEAGAGAAEPLFIDAYACRGSSSPNQHPVSGSGLSDALDTTGPGGIALYGLNHIQDPIFEHGASPALGQDGMVVARALTSHPDDQDGTVDTYVVANSLNGNSGRNQIESTYVANTIQASAGHHGHSSPRGDGGDNLVVAVSENIRAEVHEMDYAQALGAGGGKPGQGYSAIRDGMMVRRLTPRECNRLQGFPDDWDRWTDDDKEIPDSHRYRMMGNAVCVPVVEWIAHRLVAVDRMTTTSRRRAGAEA
jgi:DNA (cytosine-5)-methyltransferase 1